MDRASISDKLSIRKYAYISLFGLKDSSDIIQNIFANTADVPKGTCVERARSQVTKASKKLASFVSEHAQVPYVAGLGGVARAFCTNLVRDTLVCVDDIERKASTISINEIMGTISLLRDERNCKLVIILNDDALSDDDKKNFQLYSEKVIDKTFRFNPLPDESA